MINLNLKKKINMNRNIKTCIWMSTKSSYCFTFGNHPLACERLIYDYAKRTQSKSSPRSNYNPGTSQVCRNTGGAAQTSANTFFTGRVTENLNSVGSPPQRPSKATWRWAWAARAGWPCWSRAWSRRPPEVPSHLGRSGVLLHSPCLKGKHYLTRL